MKKIKFQRRVGYLYGRGGNRMWQDWRDCTPEEAQRVEGLHSWQVRQVQLPLEFSTEQLRIIREALRGEMQLQYNMWDAAQQDKLGRYFAQGEGDKHYQRAKKLEQLLEYLSE